MLELGLVYFVDALDFLLAFLGFEVEFGDGGAGDVELVGEFAVLGLFLLESVVVLLVFFSDSLDLVVFLGQD